MGRPELSNSVTNLDDNLEGAETPVQEIKIAGHDILEAASTSLPPNSAFKLIKNGNYFNPDEFESETTFDSPKYKYDLEPGDKFIIRGSERNAYIPGFQSIAGSGMSIETEPNGERTVPQGLTYEVGYAGLVDQELSGVPFTPDAKKQGAVLHIENGNIDARVYKDGEVADKSPREKWDFDPIRDDTDFRFSFFTVLRVEFDLYGAGDATFFLRFRNQRNAAEYKELTTVSVQKDPLLKVFNLPVSSSFELSDSAPRNVTVAAGPKQYFNAVEGETPVRRKTAIYRDVNIDHALTDNAATVIRLYRLNKERFEASSQINSITLSPGASDSQLQVREVHRDFLTFPNGFDPDDDSNWRAPPGQSVQNTSVEEAETASGNITIDTFNDEDDVTKLRGEQKIQTEATGGQGSKSGDERSAESESFVNELDFLALLGRREDTSTNLERARVIFIQRW